MSEETDRTFELANALGSRLWTILGLDPDLKSNDRRFFQLGLAAGVALYEALHQNPDMEEAEIGDAIAACSARCR
jgi:hypothetical protein